MTSSNFEKTFKLYANLMEEAKQRAILLGMLTKNALNIPPIPNFELCQLQIRKICEIISLACLVAHNDIKEVQESVLQKEYNAEKILKRLSNLHASFYPVPHSKEQSEDLTRHFHLTPRKDGFLTKDELIKSYNDCGQYLHRGSIKRLISKWNPDIDFQKIQEWNNKMGNLLAPYHYIALTGGKQVMLCVMNDINNNNAVQCALGTVTIGELV